MAHREWWRCAEIPAANGQGNARSVAAIQSIIAGRGEARGVRLLSAEGTDPIFEVQADGIDKVLGVPERIGMGYGLSNPPEMPLGRAPVTGAATAVPSSSSTRTRSSSSATS